MIVDRFISIMGVPMMIHSDQGSNFESKVFREMCNLLQIHKTHTTPLHPQSDGMVERGNCTILSIISSFVSEHQKDWDEHLPILMMAYRSSVHTATGVTPCKLMFGREINLPVDLAIGKPSGECVPQSRSQYIQN